MCQAGTNLSIVSNYMKRFIDKTNRQFNGDWQGENSTVYFQQSIVMARDGVDTMCFLSSALNVPKKKEFNQLRVNGSSYNGSHIKVAKYIVI